MSNDCLFQTKQTDIKEARCIIPILLSRGESWFCFFYDREYNCPLLDFMQRCKKREGK